MSLISVDSISRRLARLLPAVLVMGATSLAPAADDAFDPNADGNIYAIVTQPDGCVIMGGSFLHLQPDRSEEPAFKGRIARVNPDGSLDQSFLPFFNDDVVALALQPDGKILVAGKFTEVIQDDYIGVFACSGIVRLERDGKIDTSFTPRPGGLNYRPFPLVNAIAVQPDGRILIGGRFDTVSGEYRDRLARLNEDGSVDTTFSAQANNVVTSILVQYDGRILVGGGFTTVRPTGAAADETVARKRLARFNVDGTLDDTFNPAPDNRVSCLALQPDGAVLVGGTFLNLYPNDSETAVEIRFLARILSDGTVDEGFHPEPSAVVETLAIQSDGSILAGGQFSWWRPNASGSVHYSSNFSRILPDGSVDTTFSAGANAPVTSISIQPDDRIVAAGYFTTMGGKVRRRIARLEAGGALETAFAPNSSGTVSTLLIDGQSTWIGGTFASIAGVTRRYLAHVEEAGVLDDFYPRVNGEIRAIAKQADGKVVIGGAFTEVDGVTRNFLARFNADGSLDQAYDPNPNSYVNAMVVMSSGQLLIGGAFSTVNPADLDEAPVRLRMALLNADGTLDANFDPRFSSNIYAITVQADGKILVGGTFSALQPKGEGDTYTRSCMARLNRDGSVDTDFETNFDNAVYAIAVQADGKIVVGGGFTTLRHVGDTESTGRNRLARLEADGKIDTTFNPNANGAVNAVGVTSSGSIVVGGVFTELQPPDQELPVLRRYFAWLRSDGTLDVDRPCEADGIVAVIRVRDDDAIFLGGAFSEFFDAGGVRVPAGDHFLQITANGVASPDFALRGGNSTGAYVGAIALQDNGRILLGGSFTELAGSNNHGLTRLSADGSIDSSFLANVNGEVDSVLVRPGDATEAETTGPMAWLETDGEFRVGIDYSILSKIDGSIEAIAVQPDGKILLGGVFTYDDDDDSTTYAYLIRVSADGTTVDPTIQPALDGGVYAIALEASGNILIGGSFTSVSGTDRGRLARLSSAGVLDTTFDPFANGTVLAVTVLSDGKILTAGAFTTLTPNGATSATSRTYIARLNAAGTIDTAFAPSVDSTVRSMAALSTGKVLIGGDFSTVSSTARRAVARLNADGTLDTEFQCDLNSIAYTVVDLGNQYLIGGAFTTVKENGADEAVTHYYLARVGTTGLLDDTFDPKPTGYVKSIAVETSGSYLVGGGFSGFTPVDDEQLVHRSHIARLLADGSVDGGFNPGADASVETIVLQGDGSMVIGGAFSQLHPPATLYVGGAFDTVGGDPVANLARVNSNGSADLYFAPSPDGRVYALTSDASGRLLVGGAFSTIFGAPHAGLARLSAEGVLDEAFNPGLALAGQGYAARSVAVSDDGRIFVGGEFDTAGGQARANIARFLDTGEIDGSFNASTDGAVYSIVALPSGGAIIAGDFQTVNGTARVGIARLTGSGALDTSFDAQLNLGPVWAVVAQADGSLVISGAFTRIGDADCSHVARLTRDGVRDATFSRTVNESVYALALQADGRLLMGGRFTRSDDRARFLVDRVPATAASTQALSVNSSLDTVTWSRAGGAPEVAAVKFSLSTDRETWTDLGQASRSANGVWRLSGVSGLPAAAPYYLRAMSVLPSSRYASSGRFETSWQLYQNRVAGTPVVILSVPADDGSGDGNGGSGGGDSGSGDSGSGGGGSGGSGDGSSGGNGGSGDSGSVSTAKHLVNLSLRAQPAEGQPLVTGFVISGTTSQTVLLRGVGPTLQAFGVTDPMAHPHLRVYNGTGQLIDEVGAWGGSDALVSKFEKAYAFSLDAGSDDSAISLTLAPGSYTVHLDDATGAAGVGLGEIYFVAEDDQPAGLANLSARAPVGEGSATSIAGFIVNGDENRRILVRAAGPALQAFNVADAVADPLLRVYDAEGNVVAENDNWSSQDDGTSSADMAAAMAGVYAFAFAADSADAAVVVELPPGAYTVHVISGTTGTALTEIYELP